MPRSSRRWVSSECGSYHIISHLVGNNDPLNREEKEYFLEMMEQMASGFFIRIHAFCIMGTHFHILATVMETEASMASKEELFRRYKLMYGKESEPPPGSYAVNGDILLDADGGVERLRNRLGSVSHFTQELKQNFSRWYNKKHGRQGYLWSGRFKGIIVYHGIASLTCSAYIDLNPLRAGIVEIPEDYRWSSLGMRLRSPVRAGKFLHPLTLVDALDRSEDGYGLPYVIVTKELYEVEWYREFVYVSGGVEREGKARLSPEIVEQVVACAGHLGITGRMRYRIKNFTESIAIGCNSPIARLQQAENRKHIRPRSFLNPNWAYSTRVLRC